MQHKEVINVWEDRYASYLDLIIIQYALFTEISPSLLEIYTPLKKVSNENKI